MPQFSLKNQKTLILIVMAVVTLSVAPALSSFAQEGKEIQALMHDALTARALPGAGAEQGRSILFFDPVAMQTFYNAHGERPFWMERRNSKAFTRRALELLGNSWTHGLNPDQYHVAEIEALSESRKAKDRARLDLILTDALMRYGHDLGGMRIDPKTIGQKADYWRKAPSGLEVVERAASSSDPLQGVESFAPKNGFYRALREELVRLRSEDTGYDRVLPMDFSGSSHFTPGSRDKDVAALRIRLGIPYAPEYGPENYYDDETAGAVMAFQRAHGLEPDGVIGPQTLSVLNRTQRERMEQIVANLERQRWLDQEKPDRYIIVNIPQQLLWAVDRGKVIHEMKVVVGMPSRKTMEFKAEVKGVRFNPNWTVPIGIKMADFLPKLRNDPGYLSEKGIEITKGHGKQAVTLDPYAVDWQSVGSREMGQMRFVQNPGDNNALGAVRILMPNDYNIYMHDTNHREYFERGQRTYSSGCIRLADPETVANFVLARNENWSPDQMPGIIAKGRTREIMASQSFPVYIVYQTMWLDENNRLVYGADVYGRDRDLLEVLRRMNGYRISGTSPDQRLAVSAEKGALLPGAYN